MDITLLKKLGLSDKEIKIYLTLLEYGALSVRSLADLTGINRGTTYDVLKKLQEVGLVSYYISATKQKFVAEDPIKLLLLLKEKEQEIKRIKKEFSDLIPELNSLQDRGGDGPSTKLYEGLKGIRFILDDVLASLVQAKEKEYFIYSATKASDDIIEAYPNFTETRIKKKIKVKAISLAKGGKLHGLDDRRWLGTEEESATFIIIYAGKCAFISRDNKGEPIGVIINNKNIYETQKTIFRQLWRLIK